MKINRKAFFKAWVHKHIINSQQRKKRKKYIKNAAFGYHPEIHIVAQLISYLSVAFLMENSTQKSRI